MGIEHRIKEEPDNSRRCPCCNHVSTVSNDDKTEFYFYCQNPKCDVERIYENNQVMASGKES